MESIKRFKKHLLYINIQTGKTSYDSLIIDPLTKTEKVYLAKDTLSNISFNNFSIGEFFRQTSDMKEDVKNQSWNLYKDASPSEIQLLIDTLDIQYEKHQYSINQFIGLDYEGVIKELNKCEEKLLITQFSHFADLFHPYLQNTKNEFRSIADYMRRHLQERRSKSIEKTDKRIYPAAEKKMPAAKKTAAKKPATTTETSSNIQPKETQSKKRIISLFKRKTQIKQETNTISARPTVKKYNAKAFCWNTTRDRNEDMVKLHTLLREYNYIDRETSISQLDSAFKCGFIPAPLKIKWTKTVKGKSTKTLIFHLVDELERLRLIEVTMQNSILFNTINGVFVSKDGSEFQNLAVSKSMWLNQRITDRTPQELELELILSSIAN